MMVLRGQGGRAGKASHRIWELVFSVSPRLTLSKSTACGSISGMMVLRGRGGRAGKASRRMLELLGHSLALGVPNSWKIWFNWSACKGRKNVVF